MRSLISESPFMPKEGILKDYVDYASSLTDAPMEYHLFVGLTTIAVTLGNRIYLPPFGAQNIYPNLWTVLLGPTSFFRKTYSISIARNILDNFDEHLIMPDEFSPERLFEKLSERPQGLLTWSEFGGALQNFERSYMLGIKEFLTDLFDCRPKYRRELKQREYVIEKPCISILAASTPEWFRSRLREDDIRGGSFPRFIYVPAYRKTKRLAIPPKPDKALENKIIVEVKRLKGLSGEVDISRVRGSYEEWLFAYEDQVHSQTDGDFFSGFHTRLGIYTLKFAILYEVSESQSLVISSGAMSKAIMLTEYLKESLGRLFSEDLVFSRDMQNKVKVLNLIQREPGIARSKLMTHSHLLKKQLNSIIETLNEEGKIQVDTKNKPVRYYPTNLASE